MIKTHQRISTAWAGALVLSTMLMGCAPNPYFFRNFFTHPGSGRTIAEGAFSDGQRKWLIRHIGYYKDNQPFFLTPAIFVAEAQLTRQVREEYALDILDNRGRRISGRVLRRAARPSERWEVHEASLSTDDQHLCYVFRDGGDNWIRKFCILNVVNGSSWMSPAETFVLAVKWSPDGQWIYYRTKDGIFRARADGSTPREAGVPALPQQWP
jgi:hypothetical protein